MTKLNVITILTEHWKSQFQSVWDYIIFLVMPCVLGVIFAYEAFSFEKHLETIISSLSIFIGLFINVMVLLFDIVRRDQSRSLKTIVVKEVMANISFTILLSGIAIVSLFGTKINQCSLNFLANTISCFLLLWIALNVLMILKRIFILFTDEINQNNSQ